jgi:glyceraldehyde-3-phosphate dehydrogenase/erythrose-4-phosphate dehydrogenase
MIRPFSESPSQTVGASIRIGNKNFFKLIGCYGSEWGYSHRTVDLLKQIVG